jgi:hypothetical protein
MKTFSNSIVAAILGAFALIGWLWLGKSVLGVLAAVNFAFAAGFLALSIWRSRQEREPDMLK